MTTCSAVQMRRSDEGRSPALWAAIFDHQAWRSGVYATPPNVTDPVRREAALVVDRAERLTGPVTRDRMRAWLTHLSWAVANPPSDADFEKRLDAAMTGLAQVPVGALTSGTLADATRKFRFWPSVADLAGLLEPVGDLLREDLASLRYVVSGTRKRLAAPAPGVEQQNAALDAFRVARGRQAVGVAREASQPSGLDPGCF